MSLFSDTPRAKRKSKFKVEKVNRWLMPPVKMVVGPYNVEVAGPFPMSAEVIVHPIKKTVEVKEDGKPMREIRMQNLDLCED